MYMVIELNKQEIFKKELEYVKDPDITVGKYLEDNKGVLKKMVRFEVGEGIEKRNENFAEEVQKQING